MSPPSDYQLLGGSDPVNYVTCRVPKAKTAWHMQQVLNRESLNKWPLEKSDPNALSQRCHCPHKSLLPQLASLTHHSFTSPAWPLSTYGDISSPLSNNYSLGLLLPLGQKRDQASRGQITSRGRMWTCISALRGLDSCRNSKPAFSAGKVGTNVSGEECPTAT